MTHTILCTFSNINLRVLECVETRHTCDIYKSGDEISSCSIYDSYDEFVGEIRPPAPEHHNWAVYSAGGVLLVEGRVGPRSAFRTFLIYEAARLRAAQIEREAKVAQAWATVYHLIDSRGAL